MKIIMLIQETPEDFAQRGPGPAGEAYWKSWQAYSQAMGDKCIGGNILPDGGSATTIRYRDGNRLVQDGPFVDSKESLGGYMIFDVESMDEAIELASTCPAVSTGAVELRPIVE